MKFKAIRLRLATSEMIRKWARRYLSNGKIINGQISSSKTINYQTLKPEKDGLFCERIFGPVNDYICACGISSQRGHKFCPQCEVEYISSRVRRYRLGYIQFISAVAHTWFLKGNYFSLFLNLPKKKIESLLYCTQNISRTIFPKELKPLPFNLKIKKELRPFLLPLSPCEKDFKPLLLRRTTFASSDIFKNLMQNINQITLDGSNKLLNFLMEINESISSGLKNMSNWSKKGIIEMSNRVKETAKNRINKSIDDQKEFEFQINSKQEKIIKDTLGFIKENNKNNIESIQIEFKSLKEKIDEITTNHNNAKVNINKINERVIKTK